MVLLTKLKTKCSGRNLAGMKRLSEHLLMILVKALDLSFVGRGGFDYAQKVIKSEYYFCSKRENDSIYPVLS